MDSNNRSSKKEKRKKSSSAENGNREHDADINDEYASRIRESQGRLDKYTAENDQLLDEVSNLRLQIR